MAEKYSLETTVRVYDNKHGTYYEIGPDADALGMITLKYCEPGMEPYSFPHFNFQPDIIPAIIEGLQRVAKYNGEQND